MTNGLFDKLDIAILIYVMYNVNVQTQNTLGLLDVFDVPICERMIEQNAVENNCINTLSVIFLNNETILLILANSMPHISL